MTADERTIAGKARAEDSYLDSALRPRTFNEYVGQKKLLENLKVFAQAAKTRGEALDHMLFYGPPGLGKTTLAHILANEMNVSLQCSSGPAIEKKGDLAGILTSLEKGDIFFIDEIHRLNPAVEESLYPAMEDFKYEVVLGHGPHARSITLPLKKFTLIGATTRTGLLTSPMRNRFGFIARLEFYTTEELAKIILRSAGLLECDIEHEAALEIARRSRGTPRVANRLLRRVRDFAQVSGDGRITLNIAMYALNRLDVDKQGLDPGDRLYLGTLIVKFGGGPVGIETLAAAVGEEKDTLEDVYEPYLLQQGFIQRTPRGRVAMQKAYDHLDITPQRKSKKESTLL